MVDLINASNILLLGSGRLGDTLCQTLALQILSAAKPQVMIDWLVFSDSSAQVLEYNPHINQVFVNLTPDELKQQIERYDVVLGLSDNRHTRQYEPHISQHTYQRARFYPPETHISMCAVNTVRDLLQQPEAPVPANYAIFPQRQHFAKVNTLLAQHEVTADDCLIGFHMGCLRIAKTGLISKLRDWVQRKNVKHWPFNNYVKLYQLLLKRHPNVKLILTGVKNEFSLLQQTFNSFPGVINLAGKLTVLETAALLSSLKLYVCGDTGPMHIASTLGTPMVALFGPTSAQHSGPYPKCDNQIVLHKPTLSQLQVDEVLTAAKRLL